MRSMMDDDSNKSDDIGPHRSDNLRIPLGVEDALRGALAVPPPDGDKLAKRKAVKGKKKKHK